MADSPAIKAGASAQGADRPTPESGPSALHQDTSNDMPTPMEEDDLLGEDPIDYEASLEHPGMSATMNLSLLSSTLVLKRPPSLNQRNR
jgi:hypothetical protein